MSNRQNELALALHDAMCGIHRLIIEKWPDITRVCGKPGIVACLTFFDSKRWLPSVSFWIGSPVYDPDDRDQMPLLQATENAFRLHDVCIDAAMYERQRARRNRILQPIAGIIPIDILDRCLTIAGIPAKYGVALITALLLRIKYINPVEAINLLDNNPPTSKKELAGMVALMRLYHQYDLGEEVQNRFSHLAA